jgi:predicted ATP-grasp superfamily ATP-dependent carboligase
MEQPPASSQSIFVLELVSAGYFGDAIAPSFRAEGKAMLDAVLDDLRRIPGVCVETVVDDGLAPHSPQALLERVARCRADSTLIIAPEFDGLLERFCRAAQRPRVRSLNCAPHVLSLCADKLRFGRHLAAHGIPTIPAELIDFNERPPAFPCVVKPRDGAGSWLVRRIDSLDGWNRAAADYRREGRNQAILQPFVPGKACSIAAIVHPERAPDLLPVAAQHLSTDGEFRYSGGRIPAGLSTEQESHVRRLMRDLLQTLPGLNGYVGCDVLISDSADPLFVELNPRLTTSYIGYRALTDDNLLRRFFDSDAALQPVRWRDDVVVFSSNGTCRRLDERPPQRRPG